MLDSTGFLGTRADSLIDVSLVFLTATPILMGYAMTFASGREYLKHRNLQLVGLLLGFGAVVLLETSLQLGSAKGFLLSEFYGTPAMNRLFGVHLAIAIPTFLVWGILVTVSWRRYTFVLPGTFSRHHRGWGQLTFLGLCLTCATGLALYVMGYAF